MRRPIVALTIFLKADHRLHIHPMNKRSRLYIGEIKEITVVGDDDRRPNLLDVGEEAAEEGGLVGFVEDGEETRVIRFGRVLEILNVLAHNVPVGNQEALQNQFMK